MDVNLILNDHFVLVQRKSQMSLHQLPKKEGKQWTIKVGRDLVDLSTALGKPHGTFKLSRSEENESKAFALVPSSDVVEMKEKLKDLNSGENNKEIWDDGRSQQLKKEDIEELRGQGLTGSEIVSQLVENSKTFQIKTEFSQEKYLNKKEEKYSEWVEILKPNIRHLAKYFHSQDPMQILNLRPDTLAMIMSLANIKSNGKFGVFDGGCQGLVTAAILDRIQGFGTVWNLCLKGTPQKRVIQAMNFNPEQLKPLKNANLRKLKESLIKEENENGDEVPAAKMIKLDEDAPPPLEFGSLDGLVVVCRRPNAIAKELVKLLAPSGNFVIFCPYSEPLCETYTDFRECNLAVNLKLTEAWFRLHQVLPLRTHPEVNMSGSGGYILSGIKVVS
ncbi:tRNA- -methyltransferase non-catalytic subunit TRM6 [Daphnia magna]|uniref:tRNA (adenine(58)-N(1))-methyltransferase non-catalytic subunit TRM6 n=1 Tax=Daphnia magna TaxID=35525 RepID=A0A164UKV8_9CRUS|nr:tRNA- -methyltransferase non-catalytic subunit TRM6 [Daphnia magna]SVE79643.1 EOG090X0AAB [Daphnia magna]SVE80274.1 EOG090X0AAB [Daphnia magna]SVE80868.1 EOG090X0AAB [Daphnia magna]SVE83217.1 EOG090X0AAB [Daphnia magna]